MWFTLKIHVGKSIFFVRVSSRRIIMLWGFTIDMMVHCRAKELLKTYVYFIPFIFKICMQEDMYPFTGEYAKEQCRAEGNPKLGTREVVIPLHAIPEDCGNPPEGTLQPCDLVRAWEQSLAVTSCPARSVLPHRDPARVPCCQSSIHVLSEFAHALEWSFLSM